MRQGFKRKEIIEKVLGNSLALFRLFGKWGLYSFLRFSNQNSVISYIHTSKDANRLFMLRIRKLI